MRRASLPLLVILLGAFPSMADEDAEPEPAPEIPFHLPLPDGWRAETIPFPLGFAPELDYEGLEELRFSPGMFRAEAEDYWSYAFVWWVSTDTEWTEERLETDLGEYFRGLTDAVAEGEFDPGDPSYAADLSEVGTADTFARRFRGTVDAFDPFTKREALTLNVEIAIWTCEEAERDVAFFALSPRAVDHEVWEELRGILSGFRCEL